MIGMCRSSKANDIVKRVYGSIVPVLEGENLSLRILVSFEFRCYIKK